MRNLITAEEVIELAFAENSNMRADSISDTSIRIAEIKYIRPAFGAMYTLLGDKYADFTNEYVKPALAYFVKCEIIASIAIDMSNSGVAVANPQYQTAASDKQRQRLYDSEMSKAKTLLDFALEYIATNNEDFPDFSGNAPKKHHRVGGLLLGGGTSPKTSQSIAGDAFKNEIEGLKQFIEGKANPNGDYPNMTVGKAQGVVGINQVQEALTLTTKANGNIVIGNIAGQSKEFMPATPSGDPMHYAYEAEGAVWNANTGYWEFYDMTDISNEQMRRAYNYGAYNVSDIRPLAYVSPSEHVYIRFNLPRQGMYSQYVSDMSYFANGNYIIECVNITGCPYLGSIGTMQVQPVNASYAFSNCSKLRRVIGRFDLSQATNVTSMFVGCSALEQVNCYNLKLSISFADSPNLSTESILYMIENATATTAITITLHEDAYMSAMENEDIVMALAEKTKVKLASA